MKLWAISLLFVATGALADIGSVTESSGTAVIKRGSNVVNVAKGTIVELNDKVETKNGKVKITFKDNTTVNITESSTLIIDDFVYDPKSGAGKLNLKAAAGTVRYASGNIAHNNPNAVNIKTPTASIAVRGTDFVMAVDETGKSAIILMPTCETEHNVNLKGLTCGSGAIDVDSGAGIVKMNRPYQATLVETSSAPPLPPIVVDLGSAPIGNNLMLSPLRTAGGITIQVAARSAAEKTGDARKRDDKDKKGDTDKKDDNTPSLVENAAINSGNRKSGDSLNSEESQTKIKIVSSDTLKDIGVDVKDKASGDEHYYSIYKDASKTQVVGQGYEVLSTSGHNYANVVQSLDSKAVIVITQDRIVNAFDFSGTGKSTGSIVISQTWK